MHRIKERYFYYACAVIFCAIYAYLTFYTPPTASPQLGITAGGIQVLRFSFVVFYAITMFIGVRSVFGVWKYADAAFGKDMTLKQRGLVRVGYGLLSLIMGFGLSVTLGGIRSLIAPAGSPITPWWGYLTIITNYLYIIWPAVGLGIIFSGARASAGGGSWLARSGSRDNLIIAVIFSLLVTVFYGILTFTNPTRQMSADLAIRPTYLISDPLILLTIILPSFFVWVLGLLAALELDQITPKELSSEGRSARKKLVNGLWEVIFSSILIQALLSLGGARLLHLGLLFILFSIYGYFALLVLGYFTILRGAKKLLALTGKTI